LVSSPLNEPFLKRLGKERRTFLRITLDILFSF
jgi:hypothetical protein